jgi:uncharacterized RDD family membrane protein YckC
MESAAVKSPAIIDTRLTLETPEGTDLSLYPAGFWVRCLAYAVDWLVRFAVMFGLWWLMLFLYSGIAGAVFLIGLFVLEWFYPVYFEVWRNGQTIGKKIMKIKVINDDGTPVGFAAALIRNLLRVVDILPVGYAAGVLTSLCNRHFKRLGDLAAGTLVVHSNPVRPPPALEAVGSRPVPEGLSTDEQRFLLTFAQRSQTMSPARQAELAHILKTLVAPGDPVLAIKQMANTIVGRRAPANAP